MVSELDEKMLSLNEAIQECISQQNNEKNAQNSNKERMDGVCRDVIGNQRNQKELHFKEDTTK